MKRTNIIAYVIENQPIVTNRQLMKTTMKRTNIIAYQSISWLSCKDRFQARRNLRQSLYNLCKYISLVFPSKYSIKFLSSFNFITPLAIHNIIEEDPLRRGSTLSHIGVYTSDYKIGEEEDYKPT
jgi:hypothetical protein